MLINFDKNQLNFEEKYIWQIFSLLRMLELKNIQKSLTNINKNFRKNTWDTFSDMFIISDLKDFDKFS